MITSFECVSDIVAPKDNFNVISVISLVQYIGITFFPSLGGSIFQNLGANYISPILPADFNGDPLAGASSPGWQRFSDEVQTRLAGAIVNPVCNVYDMTIVVCGITVLINPFIGFLKTGA